MSECSLKSPEFHSPSRSNVGPSFPDALTCRSCILHAACGAQPWTASAVTGCRYEGEFQMGFSQGLGQYTGMNGEVYRGEWLFGKRHG